jgi:hypothetical protein
MTQTETTDLGDITTTDEQPTTRQIWELVQRQQESIVSLRADMASLRHRGNVAESAAAHPSTLLSRKGLLGAAAAIPAVK